MCTVVGIRRGEEGNALKEYLIRIESTGTAQVLFETVVSGLDSARDAAGIAMARSRLRLEDVPEDAWIEAFELPEGLLSLRVPARLAYRADPKQSAGK